MLDVDAFDRVGVRVDTGLGHARCIRRRHRQWSRPRCAWHLKPLRRRPLLKHLAADLCLPEALGWRLRHAAVSSSSSSCIEIEDARPRAGRSAVVVVVVVVYLSHREPRLLRLDHGLTVASGIICACIGVERPCFDSSAPGSSSVAAVRPNLGRPHSSIVVVVVVVMPPRAGGFAARHRCRLVMIVVIFVVVSRRRSRRRRRRRRQKSSSSSSRIVVVVFVDIILKIVVVAMVASRCRRTPSPPLHQLHRAAGREDEASTPSGCCSPRAIVTAHELLAREDQALLGPGACSRTSPRARGRRSWATIARGSRARSPSEGLDKDLHLFAGRGGLLFADDAAPERPLRASRHVICLDLVRAASTTPPEMATCADHRCQLLSARFFALAWRTASGLGLGLAARGACASPPPCRGAWRPRRARRSSVSA